MTDADLGYGDPRGVEALRSALADYLGRVRGVVADPECIVVTNGYTQGLGLVCHALAAAGAKRIALEDPSNPEDGQVAARAGLKPVPIGVDAAGTRIDELRRADADAVVLTPAHQHPTGVVLSGDRRTALLAWLRERDAIAIEDDYDAEYRYDRAAVGALQGLDPDRVVYAGSASKTLAPALRIGWLVVPPVAAAGGHSREAPADRGTARIEQHAFADFLARGELDRHLRRMRASYRDRRDALVEALAEALPEATVHGVAAGLHVTVELPDGDDEQAIREEARHRRIELETMSDYRPAPQASRRRSCSATRRCPNPLSVPASQSWSKRFEQRERDIGADVTNAGTGPSGQLLVRPPVALTLDVLARILAEIGRTEDEDLETLRPGLIASPRARRDPNHVPLLELDDLLVELHPATPSHDHVDLLLLLVRVAIWEAIVGRNALVTEAGPFELDCLARATELEVRRAVEVGPEILEILRFLSVNGTTAILLSPAACRRA